MSSAGTETLLDTADAPYGSNQTPRNRLSGRSQLTPEYTIPSSPILKDADQTPSRLVVPHTASDRTSRASSFRLSRDLSNLGSLRWDGSNFDDLDINEDDSVFGAEDGAPAATSEDIPDGRDKATSDNEASSHEETGQLNSYSALSKRADFILASAKRKLNLLEGDIKGARHSLMLPSPSSHSPSSSFASGASSARAFNSTASKAAGDKRLSQGPRINFAPPRDSPPPPTDQNGRGHARVFSETSVPSPRGNAVKGSLGLEHVRNQRPLHKSSMDRALGPVIEGKVFADYHEEDARDMAGDEERAGKHSSTTQLLRSEADDVRDRLAQIQERLRHDAEKRRSSRDSAIISQIQALEMSLHQQEEVIGELERAEESEEYEQPEQPANSREIAEAPREVDPRAEWQRILDRSDGQDDGYASSDEYNEDEEFQSVLEQQEYDDADADLDGAHEDRADAFDYEHFILHSVLGSYGNFIPERPSSASSTGSDDTARGLAEDEEDEYDEDADSNEDEYKGRRPTHQLHHNDSMASFATAQSYAADADADSDGSAGAREVRTRDAGDPWPMPPSTNSSRQTSTVFSDSSASTPTAGEFPGPVSDHDAEATRRRGGHRPASKIFSALMGPESTLPDLEEEDRSLVYSLAEALRTACLQIRRDATNEHSAVDWRRRVQDAQKVLMGERDVAPL